MDSDFLALILALLLTTYVFVFGFLKRVNEWYYGIKLGEKKHHLPPGDMGWPLIGNMWSFLKAFKSQNPDTFIHNLVRRYGRTGIYKTHMFWRPGVIVCTPEICKKVLADDEKFTRGYPASVDQITGKESFHKFLNAEYKLLRRITSASINGHETLSMYVGYIEDILMHALEEWASLNRPIELLNEMKRVFFKVIIDILVGSSAGNILNSAEKHYTDLSQGLIALAINFPGFAFHKALKARNTLENILQSVLEEKKARRKSDIDPEEKRAMMDMLMEIQDETGQKFLEDEHMISFLIMLLLAGHESSAYAVMWATIYLHDNPEMLQKAKEEQEEILKRRPSTQRGLTLQEIRQMEYLSNVFHETMRMASLFLCIFREAKVDVNINGYLVPKGWKVLVWNRELHMDPENYPNPQVFSPSRWDNQKPKAGSFIPFGAGTRICPGADLAKLQTFIFLHYFLLNYKLERVNPRGPTKYFRTPSPADNCLAKVTRLP